MLVSGYNNILLPNCTMLYYVFSGPLSLRAYVPEIKFNNNKSSGNCSVPAGTAHKTTVTSIDDLKKLFPGSLIA